MTVLDVSCLPRSEASEVNVKYFGMNNSTRGRMVSLVKDLLKDAMIGFSSRINHFSYAKSDAMLSTYLEIFNIFSVHHVFIWYGTSMISWLLG